MKKFDKLFLGVLATVALLALAPGGFVSTSLLHAQGFETGPSVNCDSEGGDRLQDIVDHASIGSTIYVIGSCDAGPYIIDKDITLTSFDSTTPSTLSTVGGADLVLDMRGASVEVRNMTIDVSGTTHGIFLRSSSFRASNVDVENAAGSGIHVGETSHAEINDSRLRNNSDGVYVTGSSSVVMNRCLVEGSTTRGIVVLAASAAIISDTDIINGSDIGVAVDIVSNVILFNSLVEGNGGPGVLVGPAYGTFFLSIPINTIQNNNPDVYCGARGFIHVQTQQSSTTKATNIDVDCVVTNFPIFAP